VLQVEVNGKNAAPLYKFLKSQKGGIFGDGIKWNFTKFLVNREGKVVERYAPTTSPLKIEVRDLIYNNAKEQFKSNLIYFFGYPAERYPKSVDMVLSIAGLCCCLERFGLSSLLLGHLPSNANQNYLGDEYG